MFPYDLEGALEQALELLQQGELVAFPTDTVYGLGAMAFDSQAIDRLYQAKGREAGKAIAILVGEAEALQRVTAGMNEMAMRLAQRFWPGPLTLVVEGHPSLPTNLSPRPTVGVRMPDHPVALTLLRRAGPLAVTSANLSGAPNANTAQEVLAQLGGRVALILDGGKTPGGLPSTVLDCTGPQPVILRLGPITLEQIYAVLEE
ncbi:MAG: L-threonylcarbamoyladenylate synthase [Anaerolineales bacterium]|nr:L-threonylcarbamoyladenylate synthase [Anaerolineales bacterium]